MRNKIIFFIKIHLICIAPLVKKAVVISDPDDEIKSVDGIN
tara:strand:+ start:3072 stop:3194 length:123 start_codon:yes stop_codon:yes gene_type:complete